MRATAHAPRLLGVPGGELPHVSHYFGDPHRDFGKRRCAVIEGPQCQPLHDPETMETNVPGVFVAGTAVAGTPPRKVAVIVETCHVHVPRIVAAIRGQRVTLPDGAVDD